MIIGSGMLATAFNQYASASDIVIYAAGVSNSNCTDSVEYQRERDLLSKSLAIHSTATSFVYFSTCSVYDRENKDSRYVQHKLAMERLVAQHPNYLIVRLPQIAGKTDNPHTLLNFLYTSITRGERFDIYKHAWRNIIDIDDVVKIVVEILDHKSSRRIIVNVANPISYKVSDIVSMMEKLIDSQAIVNLVDRGERYKIETEVVLDIADKLNIIFDGNYIERILQKYYSSSRILL